jgi:hypothetical protein
VHGNDDFLHRKDHLLKNKTGQETCGSSCQATKVRKLEKAPGNAAPKKAKYGTKTATVIMQNRQLGGRGMDLITTPKVVEDETLEMFQRAKQLRDCE